MWLEVTSSGNSGLSLVLFWHTLISEGLQLHVAQQMRPSGWTFSLWLEFTARLAQAVHVIVKPPHYRNTVIQYSLTAAHIELYLGLGCMF